MVRFRCLEMTLTCVLEKQAEERSKYTHCFKGTNLRRTEIGCMMSAPSAGPWLQRCQTFSSRARPSLSAETFTTLAVSSLTRSLLGCSTQPRASTSVPRLVSSTQDPVPCSHCGILFVWQTPLNELSSSSTPSSRQRFQPGNSGRLDWSSSVAMHRMSNLLLALAMTPTHRPTRRTLFSLHLQS